MAKTFGRLVRELRLRADMNQDELAREAGMSPSNLSKIENEIYTHPHRHRVISLAEALGRRLGWSQDELERRKKEFLRLAGWAVEEDAQTLPLDAALSNIVSLGAVRAVEFMLREQFQWPPERVAMVAKAVELFHPNSSDEPAREVA